MRDRSRRMGSRARSCGSPWRRRRRCRDRGRARRSRRPPAAKALAVAAPMPEPPPVTTATWRASGFSAALPSLACSSDQYSTSNMIGFADGLVGADGFGIGDDLDRVLGDVGGDGRVLGGGAEAEEADARHQHHARQRIEFDLLLARSWRCCARNSRDSARHRPRPPLRPPSSSRRACPLRARARAAASSWCGWCGRASPRRSANSARAPRRSRNSGSRAECGIAGSAAWRCRPLVARNGDGAAQDRRDLGDAARASPAAAPAPAACGSSARRSSASVTNSIMRS